MQISTGRRSYFVAFYVVKNDASISFAIYIVEWLYTFLIVHGNYIVQFNKSVSSFPWRLRNLYRPINPMQDAEALPRSTGNPAAQLSLRRAQQGVHRSGGRQKAERQVQLRVQIHQVRREDNGQWHRVVRGGQPRRAEQVLGAFIFFNLLDSSYHRPVHGRSSLWGEGALAVSYLKFRHCKSHNPTLGGGAGRKIPVMTPVWGEGKKKKTSRGWSIRNDPWKPQHTPGRLYLIARGPPAWRAGKLRRPWPTPPPQSVNDWEKSAPVFFFNQRGGTDGNFKQFERSRCSIWRQCE